MEVNKMTLKDLCIHILILCGIIAILVLILFQIGTNYEQLPPPNSTQEWKMILESSQCHWYNIGCQKLACVIDCTEINKNAGENICVC